MTRQQALAVALQAADHWAKWARAAEPQDVGGPSARTHLDLMEGMTRQDLMAALAVLQEVSR